MGCGCQSKKANNAAVMAQPVNVTTQAPQTTCDITLQLLENWEKVLNCVKSNDSFQKTGVAEITVNQYLGLIQSAKNYPNNYCFYGGNLNNFRNVILPKIIQNEPICI